MMNNASFAGDDFAKYTSRITNWNNANTLPGEIQNRAQEAKLERDQFNEDKYKEAGFPPLHPGQVGPVSPTAPVQQPAGNGPGDSLPNSGNPQPQPKVPEGRGPAAPAQAMPGVVLRSETLGSDDSSA